MGEVYLKQYTDIVTVLSEYTDKTAKVCTFTKFDQNFGLCKTGAGSGQHLTKNPTAGDHYFVIGSGKNYKGEDTQLVLQSWSEKPAVLEFSSYTAKTPPVTLIEVPDPEDDDGGWT
jgi:hypothetical protein